MELRFDVLGSPLHDTVEETRVPRQGGYWGPRQNERLKDIGNPM